MKKTDPLRIDAIIQNAIEAGQMADNFDLQRASSMWADVVGYDINRHTTRRYIDGTTLHVFISSAPLKNELQFQRSRLVELLNQYVGRPVLTDIRIH